MSNDDRLWPKRADLHGGSTRPDREIVSSGVPLKPTSNAGVLELRHRGADPRDWTRSEFIALRWAAGFTTSVRC